MIDFVIWFFIMVLGVTSGVLLGEAVLRVIDRREKHTPDIIANTQDPEEIARNVPEWMQSRGRSYDPRRKQS